MSLLDKVSLCITPNAYKESKLYSVIPNTTLGDMDVVRATTATRVNSAGLIEVVPRNIFTNSEQIDTADWARQGVSATANQSISPNGTLTAELLDDGTAASTQHWIFQNPSLLNGATYTISFYAKYISRKFMAVNIFNGLASQYVYYNIQDGLVSGSTGDVTASITSVGNGWFRIVYTRPMATSGTAPNFRIALADDTSNITYTGSNKQAYVWGFQLEKFATATEYFPTTTRLNIPRIDYTNGSCPSLLVEPQRTNLLTGSNAFVGSGWSYAGSANITSNFAISPDGTQNASKLTTATQGIAGVYQVISGTASVNYSRSLYIKSVSGNTETIRITDPYGTGSDGVLLTINGQWNRYTWTGILTGGANGGIWLNNIPTAGIYIYGSQMELGSYPTSYIPTVASTVTRNTEIISNNNLISKGLIVNDYVIFIDITNPNIGGDQYILDPNDISGNRTGIIIISGTTLLLATIMGGSSLNMTNSILIGKNKICVKRTGSTLSLFTNGVKFGSTTTTTAGTINNLKTGVANSNASSYINNIVLFPTALTDQECIALTTI